jgi:hypothetical protein
MRILSLLLTLTLSNFLSAQAPSFEWATSMGGASLDRGSSITTDALGNVYTTGYFENTLDFDPGAGTYNLTSNGGWDIFIQKLDANGNFIWATNMGGTIQDFGYSITIDTGGNVYTTGQFRNTADFDPGAGTFDLTSNGGADIFIQKLDASGNFIWAKSFGSTGIDYGTSIATDASGNTYTTGYFENTVDFDPGAGVFNLISNGNTDIFIQKLDNNGDFIWATSLGAANQEVVRSITTDASGNIYTTGDFEDSVDFDPGAATFNLISNGSKDIFIQKLDASGTFVWAKSMGGTGQEAGGLSTTDALGNIYTTGSFRNTVDFNPGAGTFNLTSNGVNDIFIQKLDANGTFIWAKNMGGTGSASGAGITADALGNTYTTGAFENTVDFDPGAGTFNLTSNGAYDIFIQKLDSSGTFIWAQNMGGTGGATGTSITTDALGNVYTTGLFENTVDFDPGAGAFNLTSSGNWDIFIQKLSQSGVGIIENYFGNQLLLYPNPTNGNFSIDLGDNLNTVMITMTDLHGKLIRSNTYNDSQLLNFQIEESAGIYLLMIESGDKKAVIRLVKE